MTSSSDEEPNILNIYNRIDSDDTSDSDLVLTGEEPAGFDNWLRFKKKLWLNKGKNPNAYYYRYKDPFEACKVGPFEEYEKTLFIQKLRMMPQMNKHWGIFARDFLWRVGY